MLLHCDLEVLVLLEQAVPCFFCERIVYLHGEILLIVREPVVLTFGGDDIVEVAQDIEQVDSEREKVEVRV